MWEAGVIINDLFTRDSEPQEASAGPPLWGRRLGPQIPIPTRPLVRHGESHSLL